MEAFHKLSQEIGQPEDVVALAWLLANPAMTTPVIGPRTLEQFEDSLKAIDVVLDAGVMKKLDEIYRPRRHGAEAYAW